MPGTIVRPGEQKGKKEFERGINELKAQVEELKNNNVENELEVNLTADNQSIEVQANIQFIYLQSDNTTATNRTFTLLNGTLKNQIIYLEFISSSSFTCQLVDGGNVKLSADWTPQINDTLALKWNETAWVQIGREDN